VEAFVSLIPVSAFVAVTCLVLLLFFLSSKPRNRLDVRLEGLSAATASARADLSKEAMTQMAKSMLPKIAKPLIPEDKEERTALQTRLIHAGFYSPATMSIFLGMKMLLMFIPVVAGLVAGVGGMPFSECLMAGMSAGVIGLVGPNLWLDRRKTKRQTSFRRSLPDALDVLVICLEGGLNLAAAFRRVGSELRTAHPLLASELSIMQREIQLGLSAGEAMRHFADRADLEELRSLASVIVQSDRLGASLAQALRLHAESLRFKRLQSAEEMAQKASVKMLFPTLLCIFPGVFVVVLGPAVIHIFHLLQEIAPAAGNVSP
jgi:tight adherence protein C